MTSGTYAHNQAPSALKNRNLQLYFGGQVVSLIGTWMQQVAMSWLIFRMTDSALMLGLVTFCAQAPSLLLTPFAGIIADRVDRHKMVKITQIAAMLQAGILTWLVMTGHVALWHLILISSLLGIISAFDLPARQSFLIDMLDDKSQLTQAIALNSSITTLTRLIGPMLAGLLVARAGESTCFLFNALSYFAVVLALFLIVPRRAHNDLQTLSADKSRSALKTQLFEGFIYAYKTLAIRYLLSLLGLCGLLSVPAMILMPVFARDVLHGDATTLGLLNAASALGSMLGALYIGSRKGLAELTHSLIIGYVVFGAGLFAFGFSHYLALSLPLLVLVGFGSMIVLTGSNTILQSIVDEDKRGRVMSIFFMAFMGLAPFGSMAAGALSGLIGANSTVIGMGLATLTLAFASYRLLSKDLLKKVAGAA